MNDRIKLVLAGFLDLTPEEQQVFVAEVNKHYERTPMEKRAYKSHIRGDVLKMETGPLPAGCPCCGR